MRWYLAPAAGVAGLGLALLALALTQKSQPVPLSVPAERAGRDGEQAAKAVLDAQAKAWSAGDRAALLLTFAPVDRSGKPRPAGWEEGVLKRFYRTLGPLGGGTLRFHDVIATRDPLGGFDVSARGTVTAKDGKERHGGFELTVRELDGAWLVVDEEDIPGV